VALVATTIPALTHIHSNRHVFGMHTGALSASLHVINCVLTRLLLLRRMTGSRTFSREDSFLGSASPMPLRYVLPRCKAIQRHVDDVRAQSTTVSYPRAPLRDSAHGFSFSGVPLPLRACLTCMRGIPPVVTMIVSHSYPQGCYATRHNQMLPFLCENAHPYPQ